MKTRIATLPVATGIAAALVAAVISPLQPAAAMAQPAMVAIRYPQPTVEGPARSGSYHLAQVRDVATYKPAGPIKGVAIFLSGDGGWNLGVVDMAQALAERGVAVAGISTPVLLKSLDTNGDTCVNPNFALTALAQDFEHRLGLPHYIKPILVGYSSGATIAYSALAQAPAGTWRAAVSLGFGPDIGGNKAWCKIPGVSVSRIRRPEAGWLFGAAPHLSAPWLVLQGMQDQVVSPAATKAFTDKVREARLIELPKVGHGYSVQANWMPQFLQAFDPFLEQAAPPATAGSLPVAGVGDLPLTIVADPAARHTDTLAVMYSGDGGWAGIDRDVAARLAAAGVPVVGVDSLSYFWNAKTPAQSGQDAARIMEYFSRAWHRSKVIFVGYSFGADNLAYIVGNLPAQLRPMISRVSMLGLGPTAEFQFHLDSWLNVSGGHGLPTAPAIERLRGIPMQCVRGEDEDDSACPSLPNGLVDKIVLPGGHHFDGNADAVVATLLKGLVA